MGRRLFVVSIAILAVVVPAAGLAQGSTVPRAEFGGFYIGAGLMEAWGEGGFKISGMDALFGPFSSELVFPMDGTYFVLEAGIDEIGRGFGVHLRYGSSGGLEGTAVDTDYAWDLTSNPFVKSFSSSDGDSTFLTIDLSYCLYADTVAGARQARLHVFAGYHTQDTSFVVTDVNTVIALAQPVDVFTEGLAATYDADFYGFRAGIRGELPLGRSSTLSGYLAVLPIVQADGFGQWILREKVFDHDARGWGVDVLVRYEYAVSSSVRVWGGIGLTRLEGTDGTDDQFRFGGEPIGRAHLDYLKSDYSFITLGGEFRF